jgi:hypothetical protein
MALEGAMLEGIKTFKIPLLLRLLKNAISPYGNLAKSREFPYGKFNIEVMRTLFLVLDNVVLNKNSSYYLSHSVSK